MLTNLARLEEKNCHLPKIEIDKVPGLMSDIRAKVPSYNAVPGWVVLLVKLFLDVSSYVL